LNEKKDAADHVQWRKSAGLILVRAVIIGPTVQ
jgi:hypothetical protein